MDLETWLDSSDEDYGLQAINSSDASMPASGQDATVNAHRIRIQPMDEDSQRFDQFVMTITHSPLPIAPESVEIEELNLENPICTSPP